MNKYLLFLTVSFFVTVTNLSAQLSPISLTNFNYDAVAEATTAAATTTGPLDGSNWVMYSVAYGTVYSSGSGLPNNGVITSGTYSYQLQPYTVNNCMYLTGGQTDSLILTSPAAYAGISILCFSTEGNGSMNVTLRFTDNTTQVFTAQSLVDWFGTSTAIISGFDRCSRTSGTPALASGNPKMFNLDLPITCANRAKLLKNIKFYNTTTGTTRNVIMAISGAAMPVFSVTTIPVSCAGGSNGSAVVTASGGIQPYTYTWSTTPAQSGTSASNLSVGVYSYTSQDGGLCPITNTFAVTQSLVAQPSLSLSANFYTVCAGSTVTLAAAGAVTYTWNTSVNTSTLSANPITNTTYTVGGYTSFNCYRTGTLTVVVNQLPVITFTTPTDMCIDAPSLPLTAIPAGGLYFGQGLVGAAFSPASAGVGTKTLSYIYTDANNCSAYALNSIVVNALPVLTFTLSPNSLCTNSSTLNLTATPSGGTFNGTGVTGSVYSPSVAGAGVKSVQYSYTDANGCSASMSSSVIINALPVVTFITTKKAYCTTTNSLYFNASPSGGTYSGSGISAMGGFNPSLAGAGNHTITYAYTDIYGCSNAAAISLTVSNCSGIFENSESAVQLVVYPNPSNGSFVIQTSLELQLVISNELGQTVKFVEANSNNGYSVNITDLSSGVYFVSGTGKHSAIRQKIMVIK